jgi:hypothetical protein
MHRAAHIKAAMSQDARNSGEAAGVVLMALTMISDTRCG